DFFPTQCALAGAQLPAGYASDGEDRSAALRGKPQSKRARPLFWEYGRNEKSFAYPRPAGDRSPTLAVREGDWKLLANPEGGGEELYELGADPKETRNLATEKPELAARLAKAVREWRKGLP
ncbi:MAG TPA: N-acetylgalactosamine-6-sulfatase, partial [Planctomycetia bacterium]|nr:N-acetylgalactosamine-6-sulfatase [Planctomycetia bacterium]